MVGPGDWEKTLRVLDPDDVRSLNERSVTEHEMEESRTIRVQLGLPNEGIFAVGDGAVGRLGEGHRSLSWIWCRTTEITEDDDRLDMHEGMIQFSKGFSPKTYETTALRVEWSKTKARMT